MIDLLSPQQLAAAVSDVTAGMCGMTFAPGDGRARQDAAQGRLFIFPVHGRRRFGLLLSCDRETSVSLACRLAGAGADLTCGAVIEASIRDLLARIAAALEAVMAASPGSRPPLTHDGPLSDGVPLCSDDVPGVRLWVVRRAPLRGAPEFVSDLARDFQ